jgi:hypothetical protein
MQAVVQKNCPMLAMRRTMPAHLEVRAWLKMTATPPPPAVTASGVLDGEEEGQQEDPATDRRVEDRLPDALGGTVRGVVGLLGEVRRGVEAGDRVLREQEAQRQHVEPVTQPVGRTAGQTPLLLTRIVKTSERSCASWAGRRG